MTRLVFLSFGLLQVQFKRTAKSFTNRSGTQIVERDFVVVEGDRGEDIGVVIEVMPMQEFMHRRMHEYRVSSDKDNHSVDCILRLATMHERQQLADKFQAEKNIIQVYTYWQYCILYCKLSCAGRDGAMCVAKFTARIVNFVSNFFPNTPSCHSFTLSHDSPATSWRCTGSGCRSWCTTRSSSSIATS